MDQKELLALRASDLLDSPGRTSERMLVASHRTSKRVSPVESSLQTPLRR